nr:reverse transcriptase domain-containing protein [Tanacetum cinerariifolium]
VDTVEAGQGLIRSPDHDTQTIARAADRAEDASYVRALQASERRMMTSIEEVNLRVSYQAQVHRQESENFYTQLLDAQTDCRDIRLEIDVVRGQRTAYEIKLQERQSGEDLAVTQMMRIHTLEARARADTMEDADNSWCYRLVSRAKVIENQMDPYEEVAQQGQVHPLSPAYVSDPMELDEHVPVYVPEPEHPEYYAPSDDDIQVEDDDEDPEEDPSEEHEPEDDDEDPEEDPTRISVRPQTPMAASIQALIDAFASGSSLFPLPPTSPAYDQAHLGHRAAMIRRRDDILEEDMPPQRRFALTGPPPGCDVAESSAAAAARAPRSPYDFVDTHQSAEDLAVTQMMRIHTLEAKARADTVEDVDSSCVVGLSQWLEKMESVFHISGCAVDNQVKFATCTLLGAALTWWNGHSAVTYTSISFDSDGPSWGIPLMNAEPQHPEYYAPSHDDILVEDDDDCNAPLRKEDVMS